ncbi:Imidazole glycerol phosphate synthase amidotransferase subunit [Lactococcus lactis subsp. lactis]|uniref:Imidazole glycerol phosphate synthase subunit HisH n=1 Tax=Lactococcus lactis subsp. lactis TaxID=1360 RepID=A0A0V8DSB1_LACLL|nr:imidazole glycerol phosphate synthase subunit HisH [Lactococcus lactis]KSU16233.1 Imidazole glycerol phosphate synthase amidotransferase subunit [Lactococcus lactis subsp. lactis]
MKKIVIIDYNIGNLQSVQAAFLRLGQETVISRDLEEIRKADALILPGVGAFPTAMNNLKKFNLIELLQERAAAGIPILGICLGMQVLFEKGYEIEERQGLGLLKGEVIPIKTNEKIPHMGWNQLNLAKTSPTTHYLSDNDEVYFVHSYQATCPDDELIAYTTYGEVKIPAIVGKNNVIGCQFHPEKSGEIGRKILKAFLEKI